MQGKFVEAKPEELIHSDPVFFRSFSVVIVCNLKNSELSALCEAVASSEVLIVSMVSLAFYGSVELLNYEGFRIDDKFEHSPFDFRILNPFPELLSCYHSSDVQNILQQEAGDMSNLPYPLILLFMHEQWLHEHGGEPVSARTVEAFVEYCNIKFKHRIEASDSQKWQDVSRNIRRLLRESKLPSHCQELFDHNYSRNLSDSASPFWFIICALAMFTKENQGFLPVNSKLPDLSASTSLFLAYRRAYLEREKIDLSRITTILEDLLSSKGLPTDYVPQTLLQSICQNIRHVHWTRFPNKPLGMRLHNFLPPSMKDELQTATCNCASSDGESNFQSISERYEQKTALLYLTHCALQFYREEHGAYPSIPDTQVPQLHLPHNGSASPPIPIEGRTAEETPLKSYLDEIFRSAELEVCPNCSDRASKEMVLYSGTDLHVTAAYIGSIAAQETLKIASRRGSPLDNLYIHNSTAHLSSVYRAYSCDISK